jgi:hypothetical protein
MGERGSSGFMQEGVIVQAEGKAWYRSLVLDGTIYLLILSSRECL